MGIRSDVSLAIQRDAMEAFTPEQRAQIFEIIHGAEETYEDESGFLYVWRSIKWYHDSDEDIIRLYKVLHSIEYDKFLLVCATPEYPESSDADEGSWYDNPWELRKYVTCQLEFDIPKQ